MSNPKIEKKIFLWSPMLSNVGTINAMYGIASSIKKYSDSKIYIFNILGEFNKFKNEKFQFINFISSYFVLPKTGNLSKFFIFFFSIISFPYLVYTVLKYKPNIIITGLVGFVPSCLKYFFPKLVIINSIQGLPKFNFLRKLLWKTSYKKSDYLLTMTNKTKNEIHEKIGISIEKILKVPNPILTRNIRKKSLETIDARYAPIFQKKVFCTIGRLTRQKNYFELVDFFNEFSKINKSEFNLIIIGEGEFERKLIKVIKQKKIGNIFLLGFQKNPYKFLARSDYYVSSSLWEEPGHTLIEAAYLNTPILSSDCPNGPNEIILNDHSGIKYKLSNRDDFFNKAQELINLTKEDKFKLCINMKKNIKEYTQFRFLKNIEKII